MADATADRNRDSQGYGTRDAAALTFELTHGQARFAGAQRLLCRLLHVPLYFVCVALMRHASGYRIARLAEVRRRFRDVAATPGPLLICANHLTFIDSALMIWAFGSNGWYLGNFSRFSWNLPAGDFFKKKMLYRFVALISKCVFIHRDGSKQHKDGVLQLCRHLLASGEVVTIFPEGKRSRTGRFDPANLTYGAGKLVSELGGCRVLCVYLRGDKQETYSNYPPKGATFHVDMELLDLVSRKPGREGYQDIVGRIGASIHGMEERYFAGAASGQAAQ
jgi:1-acyl-sn-glycerol-3-phosphate acyltransferase